MKTDSVRRLWSNWLRLVGKIHAASPLQPAAAVFLYAVVLCSVSFPLSLASVPNHITVLGQVKEVGYMPAINWSVSYLLMLPLTVYFLLTAFQCVPESIRALSRRGMLVNSKLQPVDPKGVLQDWRDALKNSDRVTAALFVVAIVEPLLEWWATSGYPLTANSVAAVAENELDWSVGALLTGGNWFHRLLNGVFSLMVFAQQSAMIAAFALILVFTATFCVFFAKHRNSWLVIPDKSDQDPHRGFEIFEATITHLLSAALLSLTIMYLSILQNYYLRTSFLSLYQFCEQDVGAGALAIRSNKPDIPSLLGAVPIKLLGNSINFSVSQTRLGGLVVVLLILGVPLWILRGVAKRGAIVANYAEKIEYWPLSYISLNAYLIICVVAGLSLIFYRVGLWIFGVLACALLMRWFVTVYRKIVKH